MIKKHYPDARQLRQQSHAVCQALRKLAELKVQVLRVSLESTTPIIEVLYCPGTSQLTHSSFKGRGNNEQGEYILKSTYLAACLIKWNEPYPTRRIHYA